MSLSKCIGTMSKEYSVFKEINNEKFIRRDISIDNSTYPIVMSEYVDNRNLDRVEIECQIQSEKIDGKLFTYLYVFKIKEAEKDQEDISELNVEGNIFRKDELKLTAKWHVELLPFIVKYDTYDGNKNIIHCFARQSLARKYNVIMEKGQYVKFRGHLRKFKDIIEVIVDDIDYLNREAC